MVFSRHQPQLVTLAHDLDADESHIQSWSTDTHAWLGSAEHALPGSPSGAIVASVDGSSILSAVDKGIFIYGLERPPLQLVSAWNASTNRIMGVTYGSSMLNYLRGTRWDVDVWNCTVDSEFKAIAREIKLTGPADRSWRKGQPTCACYSPDGELAAVGYEGGHIQVFKVKDGSPVLPFLEDTTQTTVIDLVFHPFRSYLVSTDAEGTCRLWHMRTGRPALTWTPDGNLHAEKTRLKDFLHRVRGS